MTAALVERFGRLDIGVNNAGFGIPVGGSETLEQSAWERVMGVNLAGVFLCAQAEAQQMIRQSPIGGKIINTASMYGTVASLRDFMTAPKSGLFPLSCRSDVLC
jgi:NAD(P)-dependent dehydrogenase (short-subunit alcohol dehydrogenase family)